MTVRSVDMCAHTASDTVHTSFSMFLSVLPRGPISSPTKLISGCSSCGMLTRSLTRINGGLHCIKQNSHRTSHDHGSQERVFSMIMGRCCKKKTLIGWRNVWNMRWRAPHQEADQRGHGKRLCKKIAKHVIWTGRMRWIVVDGISWYRLDDDQDGGWVSVSSGTGSPG